MERAHAFELPYIDGVCEAYAAALRVTSCYVGPLKGGSQSRKYEERVVVATREFFLRAY